MVTRGQRDRLFGLLRSERRKVGDGAVRFPRRKRGLVPLRWHAGTFALDGQVLRIPGACTWT
ncbi:MAG TPA: hypothetical protein VFE59_33625 [Trebonia sp.]|jgi:hypothetical protein|nr:hypothetical protein [Trebonia sp.]